MATIAPTGTATDAAPSAATAPTRSAAPPPPMPSVEEANILRRSPFARYESRFRYTVPTALEFLQNEIHPIFARAAFSNITDEQYEQKKLALQFGSRGLEHDGVCKFVDTLVNGEFFHSADSSFDAGEPVDLNTWYNLTSLADQKRLCYQDTNKPNDMASVRGRARKIWTRVAGMVDFTLSDKIASGTATSETVGDKDTQPSLGGDRFPPSCRTRIKISRWSINRLTPNENDSAEEQRAKFLWYSFNLGLSLLHELAHAVNYGTWGRTDQEPFYRGCDHSEAGLEMEAVLCGGLPRRHQFTREGFARLCLHEWPSSVCKELYHHDEDEFAYTVLGIDERNHDVVHALPSTMLFKVMTERFWQRRVTDDTPIFSTTTPAWLFKYDAWDERIKPAFLGGFGLPFDRARQLRRMMVDGAVFRWFEAIAVAAGNWKNERRPLVRRGVKW